MRCKISLIHTPPHDLDLLFGYTEPAVKDERFEQLQSLLPDMEKQMKRTESIINSMTPAERNNHLIINISRRKRIARGSGTQVNEVSHLLNEYVQMKKMMQQMMGGGGMLGGLGGKVAQRLTGIGGKKRIKVKKKKRK